MKLNPKLKFRGGMPNSKAGGQSPSRTKPRRETPGSFFTGREKKV